MNRHEENIQVLNLVQAMLGSITPNFRAVSLVWKPIGVGLYFLLEQESSEDRDEIDDIIFEFEALQSSGINVDVVVSVGTRFLEELQIPGRMVYARKEAV